MIDYIKWLREKVGHDPIFLNAAGGFVINEAGEILLLRRGRGEKADSWTIPGGIMEIGETAQETTKREAMEETGLEVEVGQLVGVYTCPNLVTYPNGDQCQMVDQIFVCRPIGGKFIVDGDETLELKYFKLKDRPRLFRDHLEVAVKDFENSVFGVSR